ncbi:MAG: hypothetical protein SVK54_04565 [candidate division WOR-3 bacterium]|nr:hypothetical protein [candidate division WOR-3 bacterium]
MKRLLLIGIILIFIGISAQSNWDYPDNRFNAGIMITNPIAETFARGGYGRIGLSVFAEYRVYKHLSLSLYQSAAFLNTPLFFNARANYNELFSGVTINRDITSLTLIGAGAQVYLLDGFQFIYYAAGPGYKNYSNTLINEQYDLNTTYEASNVYFSHGIMIGGRNRISDLMDFTIHYYHSFHNILDSFLSAGILLKFL